MAPPVDVETKLLVIPKEREVQTLADDMVSTGVEKNFCRCKSYRAVFTIHQNGGALLVVQFGGQTSEV